MLGEVLHVLLDADVALEPRLREPPPQRLVALRIEQKAADPGIMAEPLIAVAACARMAERALEQ